ncbi:uncharacterized membrane protein-like isoform X2 [Mytilus edulis]|uniref:uncharacterized membrane protein-like isoform X2 n=1 Tax=Mytilus edulis TaxID=6550 RepID=UPI0039EF12AD
MASKPKKRKLAVEPYIVLTQSYLDELASHIASNYHPILINLGMENDEIERIEHDHKSSVRRTAFKAFVEWLRKFKDKDENYMIQRLKDALCFNGRNDLCQKLDIREKYEYRYVENNIQNNEEQRETQCQDKYNSSDGEVNEEQIGDKQVNAEKSLLKILERRAQKNPTRIHDPGNTESEEEADDDSENNDDDDHNHEEDDYDVKEDEDVDDDHDDDNDEDHDEYDDNDDVEDDDDDDDDDEDDNDDHNNNEYFTIEKSIVAGVECTNRRSSILEMTASKRLVESSALLKIVSKSPLITYRQKEVIKYRLDLILTDGVTFIKGVAFERHAHVINEKISDGYVYRISNYRVKESNTVPAHKELSLYANSNIKVLKNINRIKSPPVKNFTIKEVKQFKPIKQLVHLNPVIVSAVSEIEKPKIKHLRKVLLKDYTEKVVLNVWYDEDTRHVKFEHKRGDSVQATFVEVGEFVEEIHLTIVGTTKMIKQEDKQMKKLLKNENRNIFVDKTMSIKEIFELPYSQDTATINDVQVLTFKKERESEFVYRSCSIDSSHGKLIPKGRKKYCKKCGEYLKGEKKVELNAEIKDTSDSRTWIKIFDQSAKAILGNSYNTFLDCSDKERVSILKKIERNDALYFGFKVSVKKDKCNYKIIAKQVEII